MKKPWPVPFCLTAFSLGRSSQCLAQSGPLTQPIYTPNILTPSLPYQGVGNLGYQPGYSPNTVTNGYQPLLPNDEIIRSGGNTYQSMFYSVGQGSKYQASVGGLQFQAPDLLQTTLSYQNVLQPGAMGTNAAIRIGRFYYSLNSVSGSVLYSDNVNWSQTNRQSGEIAIVTLRGTMMVQLLDNLRLAASLGVVYFPIKSKVGIEGFTQDTEDARVFLGNGESTKAQLTYDLKAGEWDIFFYDQIRATQALYVEQFNASAAAPFDEEDRAGRYAFFAQNGSTASGKEVRVNDNFQNARNNDTTFLYANNQVGATVSRLLPTDTRLRTGVYRLDYWYLGENAAFVPSSAEVAFVDLRSERDNLRFKPFATYEMFRYGDHRWDQEAVGGIQGPITENLEFTGAMGYFWGGRSQQNTTVGYVQLNHQIGPLTSQAVTFRREVTAPVQDIEQSVTYEFRQQLGPRFTIVPFAKYATFTDPAQYRHRHRGGTRGRAADVGPHSQDLVHRRRDLQPRGVQHWLAHDVGPLGCDRPGAASPDRYLCRQPHLSISGPRFLGAQRQFLRKPGDAHPDQVFLLSKHPGGWLLRQV